MDDSPEPIYPLVEVLAGDYLLLSDDRRTLWRIRRRQERFAVIDEPTGGRSGWGVWRWTRRPGSHRAIAALDLGDPSQWAFWEGSKKTRTEAVADALSVAPRLSRSPAGRCSRPAGRADRDRVQLR